MLPWQGDGQVLAVQDSRRCHRFDCLNMKSCQMAVCCKGPLIDLARYWQNTVCILALKADGRQSGAVAAVEMYYLKVQVQNMPRD
jgi:hypothetical protein